MWTDLYAEQPAPQATRILSDVELFLRSKRKYLTLMEQYNPPVSYTHLTLPTTPYV